MTTKAAKDLDLYFSGTVEQKLATAEQLFARHGASLLQQHDVQAGLIELGRCGTILASRMQEMGMGNRCRTCACSPGGGCCSSYMAANSDAILLLINLLIGTEISIQRANPNDCCFLGPTGCSLKIKPIFCLNYNCSHITEAASIVEMKSLEQAAATVLGEQTKLEAVLLERLSRG